MSSSKSKDKSPDSRSDSRQAEVESAPDTGGSEQPDGDVTGAGAESDSPRVGDILAGRVSREALDPVTVSELAAWFGAPAQSVLDAEAASIREQTALGPDSSSTAFASDDGYDQYDDPELRELWRQRRKAMAAVDAAFLARLESWTGGYDEFVNLPEPMSLPIENGLEQFDLAAWRLNFLEVREWEVDEDLYEALRERAPQAVLRDLHRPVETWPLSLEPTDLGVDIAGAKASRDIRDVLSQRYSDVMSQFRSASLLAQQHLDALRGRLREPWENSYIPESERPAAGRQLSDAEIVKWFGAL